MQLILWREATKRKDKEHNCCNIFASEKHLRILQIVMYLNVFQAAPSSYQFVPEMQEHKKRLAMQGFC